MLYKHMSKKKPNNIGTGMSTINSLTYLAYNTAKPKTPTVKQILEEKLAHEMLNAKTDNDIELISEYSRNIDNSYGDEEREFKIKKYLSKNKSRIEDEHIVYPMNKIKVHCHNCNADFFAGELIWTVDQEHPNCKNFPICPNPWPEMDVWWGRHAKDWVSVEEEQ